MTQVESIQQNIHEVKTKLYRTIKTFIPKNEIEVLHKQSNIDYYLNELKDLNFSLKCAIKAES